MSRGLRWSPESMTARGWRDPKAPADAPQTAQEPRQRVPAGEDVSAVIPYERDVLRAVLAVLDAHPRVAWAVRFNSGTAMMPGRGGKPQPVRFGFEGAPDIIGQMGEDSVSPGQYWRAGAFLAIECKRPGKHPTLAQAAFLLNVRENGGVAFCATSVEDVFAHLGRL